MKTPAGLLGVANGLLRQRTVAVMNHLLLGSVHILRHHENGLCEPFPPSSSIVFKVQPSPLPYAVIFFSWIKKGGLNPKMGGPKHFSESVWIWCERAYRNTDVQQVSSLYLNRNSLNHDSLTKADERTDIRTDTRTHVERDAPGYGITSMQLKKWSSHDLQPALLVNTSE